MRHVERKPKERHYYKEPRVVHYTVHASLPSRLAPDMALIATKERPLVDARGSFSDGLELIDNKGRQSRNVIQKPITPKCTKKARPRN